LLPEGYGDSSVFARLRPNIGRFSRRQRVDALNAVLPNEPVVEQETEAAVGKTCVMGKVPDEARAERGNDEDTPDRPFTMADHVDALLGLPSMKSTGRAVKEHDPRM
jgi:hypothetical protein